MNNYSPTNLLRFREIQGRMMLEQFWTYGHYSQGEWRVVPMVEAWAAANMDTEDSAMYTVDVESQRQS